MSIYFQRHPLIFTFLGTKNCFSGWFLANCILATVFSIAWSRGEVRSEAFANVVAEGGIRKKNDVKSTSKA